LSRSDRVSERAGDAGEVLGSDVGLTAQIQAAPCIALQTEGGLTAEQAFVLTVVTVTEIEARLDLEDGLQAVTQVFGPLQTPAVAGLNTVDHAGLLGINAARTFNLLVANTAVQNTVQGHGRFCLSNAGKAKRKSSSEQSLFHVRNLRRFE